MLFDSHAHINNDTFTEEEREALIKTIGASDLSYVMDVGFDPESSLLAVRDAGRCPKIYAVVGCHPHDAEIMDDKALKFLKGLAKEDRVKAIGEIGLDYHYDRSERDAQREWFRRQIRLALELGMPMVIHTRDAEADTMRILKEEGAFSEERRNLFPARPGPDGKDLPDSRVLIHCFSGSIETALEYVKLGATLSVCGPVTFKNNKKARETVRRIPIEFLLVETDSPYLAPEPFRGKPNNPTYVEYTARKVAELKGISYEEAAEATCVNAKRFFRITK